MLHRIKTVSILAALLITAGCQVQPLYSTSPLEQNNQSTTQNLLSSITIEDPKSRLDQLVRNELNFTLSGSQKASASSSLILKLNTTKEVRSVGISDVDFGPRAFFVTIKSDYVLSDPLKAASLAQGTQEGTASYDRVDQEFANIRSERDAEIRAAKAVALRIRHALSLALSKKQ